MVYLFNCLMLGLYWLPLEGRYGLQRQLNEAQTKFIISQVATIYLAYFICHVIDMLLYLFDIYQNILDGPGNSSTIGDE